MEELDQIAELLTNNPIPGIVEDITANLPPDNFPPAPPVGGGTGGLPFGQATAAAFAESAADFQEFVTVNLTDYGTRTADAIRVTAEAYSDAFQGLAGALRGLAPEQGNPGMGGDAPGMATAMALAEGFDGLGEAVAQSLGNQGDFGAVYAAETIGEALTGAGEDIAEGFATGAAVIEAIGEAITNNAPGQEPADPADPGPEGQFVEAIEGGFAALIDGYNTGAEVLSGTVPEQIADGITTVGEAFLAGAGAVTTALVAQIEGFMLPEAGGGDFPPSDFEVPAPLAEGAAALQEALEGGAEQLMGALEGFPPAGGDFPPDGFEVPAPLAEGAAALQEALEGGAEQLMGALEGFPPAGGDFPPDGFEVPAPLADGAAQLQTAFEDGAAALMDLPATIQAGITSLASQFPTGELPFELPGA